MNQQLVFEYNLEVVFVLNKGLVFSQNQRVVFSCLNTNFLRADCSAPPTCYSATTTVWFLFSPFVHNLHNLLQLVLRLRNQFVPIVFQNDNAIQLICFYWLSPCIQPYYSSQLTRSFFLQGPVIWSNDRIHLIRQQRSLLLKGFLCQLSIVITMGQSPMPLCQKQRNAPPFKVVSQNNNVKGDQGLQGVGGIKMPKLDHF